MYKSTCRNNEIRPFNRSISFLAQFIWERERERENRREKQKQYMYVCMYEHAWIAWHWRNYCQLIWFRFGPVSNLIYFQNFIAIAGAQARRSPGGSGPTLTPTATTTTKTIAIQLFCQPNNNPSPHRWGCSLFPLCSGNCRCIIGNFSQSELNFWQIFASLSQLHWPMLLWSFHAPPKAKHQMWTNILQIPQTYDGL